MVQQCPNLSGFTLSRVPLEVLMTRCGLLEYSTDEPKFQVKIVDAMVSAFSVSSKRIDWTDPVGSSIRDIPPVLGHRADSYLPVADVVLESYKQFTDFLTDDRLTWPYPDQQIVWLKQSAPFLNEYPDVISAMKTLKEKLTDQLLCPEHEELCCHLDLSFYTNMTGPGRSLIASLLLKLRPAKLTLPPVAFGFKRLFLDTKSKVGVAVDL